MLVVAALVTYAAVSVAVPLAAGRDLPRYLLVYAQLFDADVALPARDADAHARRSARRPEASSTLGPVAAEAGAALLYALSILAWCSVARRFGAAAAIATAAALLLYPGLRPAVPPARERRRLRCRVRPRRGRRRACGGAARPGPGGRARRGGGPARPRPPGRPGSPPARPPAAARSRSLGRSHPRHRRLRARRRSSPARVVGAQRRSGSTTSRSRAEAGRPSRCSVPSSPTASSSPQNGPASRELARVVARDLLPYEPYRSYGIDLDGFFSSGSARMHDDLTVLSDRTWGWDDDYRHLARVGREAVLSHPGAYLRGVARDFRRLLVWPIYAAAGGRRRPRGQPRRPRRSCRRRARASRSRRHGLRRTSRPRTAASARCGPRRPSTTSSSRTRRTRRARPRSTAAWTSCSAGFPDREVRPELARLAGERLALVPEAGRLARRRPRRPRLAPSARCSRFR